MACPLSYFTCYLNNDDAGRMDVDELNEIRDGIHDAYSVYADYKGLIDFLRGKHFCS